MLTNEGSPAVHSFCWISILSSLGYWISKFFPKRRHPGLTNQEAVCFYQIGGSPVSISFSRISIWSVLGWDIGFGKSSLRSNRKSSVADQGCPLPKFWNSIGIPNCWEMSNFRKKLEFQGIPLEFQYQWLTFSIRFPTPVPIPIFGFQSFPNPNPNLSQNFFDFQFQLIAQHFQLIFFPTPN